ncbi:hypothetical protein NA57DRAFT_76931 [Rhizodiscina lignyota]|uniref:C2H2-type domain-containing protein n=1 Tax=Rhizodiscina lignyota TaxID=1504668 RepID=A0A9P4IAA0_9PEZI|nr:hypothetical protein NA57DRAFT_76931 [Rhizodiscina lignyota]
MVHGTGRNERREASQHFSQQNFYYPQSHPRAQQQPVPYSNTYSPNATPYFQQHPQQHSADYAYHQRVPQSPPSPPGDEIGKPSLPSISSLLHIAGSERMTSDTGSPKQQSSPQHQQEYPAQQQTTIPHSSTAEERPDPSYQPYAQPVPNAARMTLPPTPPMRPDSVDGVHSPSTISSHSSFSNQQPYYLGQTLNNVDPHTQRQTAPPFGTTGNVTSAGPPMMKRHSLPSQSTASPYGPPTGTSSYTNSPYGSSPGAGSSRGYYSPDTSVYPNAGLYEQRPLPSNFPPPPPPVQIPLTSAVGPSSAPASTNSAHHAQHAQLYAQPPHTHQHHHYISPSSASAFPQSQDRYICTTCNKAFSRPSSLRIHIHSHTGEKPFKCPHAGCGKAFSVRSNMKRHERGCHAGGGGGGMM